MGGRASSMSWSSPTHDSPPLVGHDALREHPDRGHRPPAVAAVRRAPPASPESASATSWVPSGQCSGGRAPVPPPGWASWWPRRAAGRPSQARWRARSPRRRPPLPAGILAASSPLVGYRPRSRGGAVARAAREDGIRTHHAADRRGARCLGGVAAVSRGTGDGPLLPARRDPSVDGRDIRFGTVSVSRSMARCWWARAEPDAGLEPKRGRGWHSLRRKFATRSLSRPRRRPGACGACRAR